MSAPARPGPPARQDRDVRAGTAPGPPETPLLPWRRTAREGLAWSGTGDPWGEAVRTGRGPLFLHRDDGWLLPLDVERWCAAPDAADRTVLDRCHGSVLDIGCGPGRFVLALAARDRPVLGIDLSGEAVDRVVRAGAGALCRSVFGPLPGTGRWDTALLVDGNIGIGGDPGALLRRAAQLVRPGGTLIVETWPSELDERVRVRVRNALGESGSPFRWARVGPGALLRLAEGTGWEQESGWEAAGRSFCALRRTR